MTDIHHATPSQIAEHTAHIARQRRLGVRVVAEPQVKPIQTQKAAVAIPEPHFWFSILEEIEPVAEREITCADIKRAIASHFKLSVRDLISDRRTANVVLPRQIGIYLAREMTLLSCPQIGRQFGNRDHTTVLHAINKVGALLSDGIVAEALKKVRSSLRVPAS